MSVPPEAPQQSLAETGNQVNEAYERHIRWLGPLALPVAWFLVPATTAVSKDLSAETNSWIARRAWVRTLAVGVATIGGAMLEHQLPNPVTVGLAIYTVLAIADAFNADHKRWNFQK